MNKTFFILTVVSSFCSPAGAEPDLCDWLLHEEATAGKKPVSILAESLGDTEEVRQKKKEEFQRKHPLQYRFFEAVKKNDLGGAKKCLAQGADINGPDDKGLVPLHYAAYNTNPEMVRRLLAHGADVNRQRGHSLWTPLHYVLGGDEVMDEPGPSRMDGKTMEVLKILVEAKANVNAEDDHGVSPVYLAIGCGDLKILQYLADHGGKLDEGWAYRGQTPLLWAITNRASAEVVEFILKHGGTKHIDVSDGDGNAPLHHAVRNKDLKIVKCLVEHGADVKITTPGEDCKTPLDLAEEEKLTEIAKYLKAHGGTASWKIPCRPE